MGGPVADSSVKTSPFEVDGMAESVMHNDEDYYTQPGDLYRLMSEDERARLVQNFADHMRPVTRDDIKLRQIEQFYKADPDWGERIAKELGLSVPKD